MNSIILSLMISAMVMATSLFSFSAWAAESGITDFSVRIKASTCTLSTVPEVDLGSITVGTTADVKQKFLVNVLCPGQRSSYIWANVKAGTGYFATAGMMWMYIGGSIPSGQYGTRFSLLDENGQEIALNGIGEQDAGKGFCSGDSTRSCAFTPRLIAGLESSGEGSISMIFNIRHI